MGHGHLVSFADRLADILEDRNFFLVKKKKRNCKMLIFTFNEKHISHNQSIPKSGMCRGSSAASCMDGCTSGHGGRENVSLNSII